MMRINPMGALVGGMLLCASSQSSFAQSALVEDVTGKAAGVDFMDYVDTGKIIRLGQRDSIVLSYIQSCVRETIKGGTVTIGTQQSDVDGGRVDRAKVDCDASKMMQTPKNMSQAAGVVFRGMGPKPGAGISGAAPKPDLNPQFTLYGLSPIVQVNGTGELLIERLDKQDEPPVKVTVGQDQLMKGAFFDCATKGISLVGGGVYRASWGTRHTVFKVDSSAKSGRSPIIGRLVKLVPAT